MDWFSLFFEKQLDNPTSTIAQIALAGAGCDIVSSYITGFRNHFETDTTSKSWFLYNCNDSVVTTELIKIRQP